jgi:hypothetical protein
MSVGPMLPFAAAGEVLHDHDSGPFTGIFGLPDSTEGGDLLAAGQTSWNVLLQTASHSVADVEGAESLVVDGETTRLEISYRRGFGKRLEMGIELPYLTHQAGGLDSVIDDWHDAFGLPDGARDDRPRDQLEYRYVDGGNEILGFDRSVHGVGDLRILFGYGLAGNDTHSSALRLGIKIPTGDAPGLLGSGAVDVSVGVAGDWHALDARGRFSAFYRLNLTWLGEPEYLADRYREVVYQASTGIRWQASPRIGLSVQGSLRSAEYDSEIEMLGGVPATLTFGGDIRLSDSLALLIAVGEDINVGSTPDVTFQLALRYRPAPR